MESLLVIGKRDDRREKLLTRLGYDVILGDETTPINDLLSRGGVVDLVVIETALGNLGVDLCGYLRNTEITKQIPIIFLSEDLSSRKKLEELKLEKVDCFESKVSVGVLASKIATRLRLQKMAGLQESTASLTEINAALRDLNQRMKKEREEARAIHENLLPEKLPSDPRFDIAVTYDPLEEVGGDWYFVQQESSGKISIQIADVTGHGLAAAFIGSMTKLAMSAAHCEEPKALLEGMNRLITPQLPPDRFVTMASALFDPATGKVQISVAGHPPALHVSCKEGTVTSVGNKAFALGFTDDATFAQQEITLEQGDFLLMLTDGLTEAQNRANQMFGAGPLTECLGKLSKISDSKEIVRKILEGFNGFCDGRLLKDDVTVIVLRRT